MIHRVALSAHGLAAEYFVVRCDGCDRIWDAIPILEEEVNA